VTFDDLVSGERGEIRARCLINAAGPWYDEVRRLRDADAQGAVQLTRGIHLVVSRERLPVADSVVLRSPDGRSTFVVPRDEFVYVGTTDTHYEGPAEEPGISADDVAYLLESLSATFVDAPTADDVVGAWSGVRPLLRQEGKAPSEISRKDEIHTGPGPVVAIAGGKLTTFRRMAERVVDQAESFLGGSDRLDPRSAETPLHGGSADDQRRARDAALRLADGPLEDRLWRTYGTAAAPLIARIAREPQAAERVAGLECMTIAELEHCIDEEMVVHLDDLLRRRSYVAMFDTAKAIAAAEGVGTALGDRLGWDSTRKKEEIETFVAARGAELRSVREDLPARRDVAKGVPA
jgi:glycerol-3-phosphate dehydrogenase